MSTTSWRVSRADRDAKYRSIAFTADIRDYELITSIGGVDDMSFMYLSLFKPAKIYVALKYTDLSISPDIEFVEELMTVINNTMKYRHPSLLPYFHSFVENERLWSVTLPMKAGSLRSILDEQFPLGFSETTVATILKYLLRALCYLHNQGLIHNDVRADNILLDFNGDVRVVGLHQVTNLAEGRAAAFDYVGNPEWMAPELFEQQVSFDFRSDIYSVGITAMELAFGKTPYRDWPPLKILVAKLKYAPPISEQELAKGKKKPFSKQFYGMIRACLERDPARRPSAADLLKHPFLRRAKGASFLVDRIIKSSNLVRKHATARPGSPTIPKPGSPALSSTSGSALSDSASPSAMSSSTALHAGSGRPLSPHSHGSAVSSISELSVVGDLQSRPGSAASGGGHDRRQSVVSQTSHKSYLSTTDDEAVEGGRW
ncbi:STE/STE20/FRAY protein kinase [Allomyces macrogynus ATCC 38327]|uniref:STE/STE20/FRAY protein kinase n=1 Tax=Allomyces macrogynus (strain ATCC 38327) TaxID=578462 RepID=A0A0L0SRN0_ALLM3|nr:STE/STE20/FRAY protein kinase [Allomyces macrogynus ATCC 38327]|eukprot:KNE65004.1 STE/STE20/FRAY protein kinase [Allomyces macrogynus ATCC 38327]